MTEVETTIMVNTHTKNFFTTLYFSAKAYDKSLTQGKFLEKLVDNANFVGGTLSCFVTF